MDRSEAKRSYKETERPMGVFRIRIAQAGKSYVGFSLDLPAIFNRHRTELKFGSHRNKELLKQWKTLGEAAFEFEVLDELEPEKESQADPAKELGLLTEMWITKLKEAGEEVAAL